MFTSQYAILSSTKLTSDKGFRFAILIAMLLSVSAQSVYADAVNDWNAWDGDTKADLTLSGDVYFNAGATSRILKGTATLQGSLDGDGKPLYTIDGKGNTSQVITTGNTLTITNVNMQNADTKALRLNGSMVYNSNSETTVSLTGTNTFSSNQANSGGVIYSAGTVSLEGSSNFTNNTVQYQGGAIIAIHGITIDCNELSMTNNTASDWGGAIYAGVNESGTVTISATVKINTKTSGTFSNNKAVGGGAISVAGILYLSGNNSFSGNEATSSNGGAINGDQGVELSGTNNFSNNKSYGQGGAINAWAPVTFKGDSSSATFTGNTAGGTNNDVWSGGELTFQDSGTYSFDGGVCTGWAGMTITNKAAVHFNAGSVNTLGTDATQWPDGGAVKFTADSWENRPTITIDLNDKVVTDSKTGAKTTYSSSFTALNQLTMTNANLSIDVSNTNKSMSVKNMVASGTNNLSIKYNSAQVSKRGDTQTIIATTVAYPNNVTGFNNVTCTITNQGDLELWTKVKSEGVVVLSPLVYNTYDGTESDKDVSIHDTYYYNPTTSANQSLTLLGDLTETQTTVLNNSNNISTLSLQSDGDTVRVVTGPASNPILQNTAENSVTNLTLNKVTLTPGEGGTAINANTVNLSGNGTIGTSSISTLNITGNNSDITFTGTVNDVEIADGATLHLQGTSTINSLNSTTPVTGTPSSTAKLTANNDITISEASEFYGYIQASGHKVTFNMTNSSDVVKLYSPADKDSENRSMGDFVLASGNLNMKGYFDGSLELQGGTFSPGNSVGDVYINGATNITGSAMILMEVGGKDGLNTDTFTTSGDLTLRDDTIIFLTMAGDLKNGDTIEVKFDANNSADFADDFISKHVQMNGSFYNLEYKNMGTYYAITGTWDTNAVPEPSTWALLILGIAGLMKVASCKLQIARKRNERR